MFDAFFEGWREEKMCIYACAPPLLFFLTPFFRFLNNHTNKPHRSGFFTLFTLTLITSQIHLILLNMTTVEHLSLRSQKEREGAVLGRMLSPLACRWVIFSSSLSLRISG